MAKPDSFKVQWYQRAASVERSTTLALEGGNAQSGSYPSDATGNSVQANIVAARYGQQGFPADAPLAGEKS
jgi:hypothetical protein